MATYNRFRRTLGTKPIFKCRECKRQTRVASSTNGSSELCPQCDERTMIENGISDNHLTGEALAEAEERMEALKKVAIKRGGVLK